MGWNEIYTTHKKPGMKLDSYFNSTNFIGQVEQNRKKNPPVKASYARRNWFPSFLFSSNCKQNIWGRHVKKKKKNR